MPHAVGAVRTGSDPGVPRFEDLHELHYVEMAIKEALRMFPSVPMIARMLDEGAGHVANPPAQAMGAHALSAERGLSRCRAWIGLRAMPWRGPRYHH